jgi:unsaturated chondroitin disaccharide hydrolase
MNLPSKLRAPLLFVLLSSTLLVAYLAAPAADGQSAGCTDQALALAEGQLSDSIVYLSTAQFANTTNPANANRWGPVGPSSWTSGFFPGWMWLTYENTLSPTWLSRAQAQTANLQSQDVNASDHDIGFKILGSYGNGYRISRDPAYMSVIQTAAQSMSTLYRPGAGVIESWPNYDSHITVIVDNMMNLELLLFAAQNGGNPTWRDMAVSHALKTMQNHVRADGGTYHVVDYNSDGTVFSKFTVQGAGNETSWARGQAWGLYGFTMVYRYTKDQRFLDTAQHLADYFISHLPTDFVPYWDFSKCCTDPRDSSAAAIAAAGLLELSTYAATQSDRDRYRTAALNIQTSLSSSAYLGDRLATDGVLLHGSANVPGNSAVDVSLIYGDYYFIQSCYRAKTPPTAPTNPAATAASGTQVNLSWDSQTGVTRYSVKRSTISGGPYTTMAPPPILTTNNFSDSGLTAGTTYHYVVSAINVAGESPNSAEVSLTTPGAAQTSTTLTSSLNPSKFGQSVTFTATVKSPSATPTGSVAFKDGTYTFATVPLTSGVAKYSIAKLAARSHSITAVFLANANFTSSTSPALTQTVSQTSTLISLASSLNPATHGSSVTFSVLVRSSTTGTPTGTVTFKDGATVLGTGTLNAVGKTTFATSTLAVGSHSITAVYAGSSNFTGSTSPTLTQKIN